MSKDTVERFSDRVANYVKYRPHYPGEMLDLFRREMNLAPDSVVADVGSGTGISARLFLENGNPVYGVEPNAAMRAAAEEFLQAFPQFHSIDGTAENTGLPDNGVDLIIAAQAFHWFNNRATQTEFRRILRDKGFVALIWNERQLDTNDFLREYELLLLEFGSDYAKVRHDQVTREMLAEIFQINFREAVFANSQTLDFESLKGRMLSASYMPAADSPHCAELIEKLKSLFANHAENGKIQILYDTKIFYTQF